MDVPIALHDQNHPDRRTLAAALRARPSTVPALSTLVEDLPGTTFSDSLSALTGAGFLSRRGDVLDIAAPDLAVVQAVQQELVAQAAGTARIAALLDALPSLLRDWELGQPGEDHPLRAEVIHGQLQVWEAWWRFAARDAPRSPCCVIPDPDILLTVVAPDLARVAEFMGTKIRMRALVPVEVAHNPQAAAVLRDMTQIGFEVRTRSPLPSWFYVDEGVVGSMPVTWGESMPSSMLLVRNPTVTGALSALFELLWDSADPLIARPEGWSSVLNLLARGMPDESIASALNLSVRTVRRRIAEAMEDLNAPSRFTLGIAWARHEVGR